ncbi:MAG: Uma2 family endonuclease [Blastocatellia bacterium]
MIAAPSTYYAIVSQLPGGAVVTFHDATWEEYEELLEQVGEAAGLRISYNDGTLKVMSLSHEHEKYVRFIESLIVAIKLALRVDILSFGSATMRKAGIRKGNEPDASFYIQTAGVIGNRIEIDLSVDPPPDVVLEVDIHHASQENDSIYAAFGVPEIWRFEKGEMFILRLHQDRYLPAEASAALPMLTPALLTAFLSRMRQEGDFAAILAFDEWLRTLRQ